jgi:hypothetical protein
LSDSNKKRQRTDTAQGALNSMSSAMTEIQPPEHCFMRPQDMPYWNSLMRTRDAKLWTEPDLEIAANLAACKSDIDQIRRELSKEPNIRTNARGTPVVNPKHQLLETLSRRCVALSRMLHVHAEATSGKAPKEQKKNTAANQARQVLEDLEDDDLIARPH